MVRFANYTPLPDGVIGHPTGLAWFCRRHLRAARSLADESLSDALQAMGMQKGMFFRLQNLFVN